MTRKLFFGLCLASWIATALAAQAQEQLPPISPPLGPPNYTIPPGTDGPLLDYPTDLTNPQPFETDPNNLATPQTNGIYREPESLPAEINEEIFKSPSMTPSERKFGPTPVSSVGLLQNLPTIQNLFGDSGIKTFGWVEGGYTYSSSGSGPLSVQTRQNRFGDEFLLNQIGLVMIKPLKQDQFDVGFNVRYFAGADAALGQPGGGIDDPPGNPRFSHDFRDLNISAHLPIFTEGGMDVKVGRMNTIIGYNGFLAPYRPFYSSDYQFFYSQDGAFTGFLTNLHVNKRLEIWNGMTLGANTFFEKRSENSFCYIGQINYWLTDEQKTRLTASTTCGPDAIFAAPGLAGDFVTVVELRVQHQWTERFFQVVQSNMGWDDNTPVGTGSWYGLYTIGIFHLTKSVDVLGRAEWFKDVKGTRTGFDTDYSAVTLGFNWHPNQYLEIRPEIRGDFAGDPVYGGDNTARDSSQLTMAFSALLKF